MIEKIILDYLISCNIAGIGGHVYMEVPVSPPSEYIVIEKTAGGEIDKIDSAMAAIQSYSRTSLLAAAMTNHAVVEAMKVMAETVAEVYSSKLNTDYNFTNPDTKEYRYQAVFNLYF